MGSEEIGDLVRSRTHPSSMSFPAFIALRYLRSRRNRGFISFITLIAVTGVTLGVATLIITLSILSGFEKTIQDNLVRFTSHLQLFAFGNQVLPNPRGAINTVKDRFPQVVGMAPYVAREGLVQSPRGVEGVLIKGIDPQMDISRIGDQLVEGHFDLAERSDGLQSLVLGKRLGEKLEIAEGDKVTIFGLVGSSISLSQTRVMQFVVAGLYDTGMAEYDESYVYINIRNAQTLFNFGNAVSGFDVNVSDLSQLSLLAQDIPQELGYPYYARTMYQMHRNLFTWVELQKEPIPIILGLIIIVATVNIIGTLLMMVMEKVKEIGILRALGSKKRSVGNIFMLQGILIGVVGTTLGNAVAYGLCQLEMHYKFISLPPGIYYMSHVPIELVPGNFLIVSAAALVMCFLSSLLPSRFAARQDPVATIRFT